MPSKSEWQDEGLRWKDLPYCGQRKPTHLRFDHYRLSKWGGFQMQWHWMNACPTELLNKELRYLDIGKAITNASIHCLCFEYGASKAKFSRLMSQPKWIKSGIATECHSLIPLARPPTQRVPYLQNVKCQNSSDSVRSRPTSKCQIGKTNSISCRLHLIFSWKGGLTCRFMYDIINWKLRGGDLSRKGCYNCSSIDAGLRMTNTVTVDLNSIKVRI